MPVYRPGGVRHTGDAILICGCCMERGKAGPDTSARRVWGGKRKSTKQQKLRGVEYRRGACWRTGS